MSVSTVNCNASGYKVSTEPTSCPCCSKNYNSTINKPLSLGCQHCVCQHCAGAMSQKSKKVTCGTCKKTTKLGEQMLPVDSQLLEQIIALSVQPTSVVVGTCTSEAYGTTKVEATKVEATTVEATKVEAANVKKTTVQVAKSQSMKMGSVQPTSINVSKKKNNPSSPNLNNANRVNVTIQMCNKCAKNPAEVSVINAKLMKTEHLCRSCTNSVQSTQEQKVGEAPKNVTISPEGVNTKDVTISPEGDNLKNVTILPGGDNVKINNEVTSEQKSTAETSEPIKTVQPGKTNENSSTPRTISRQGNINIRNELNFNQNGQVQAASSETKYQAAPVEENMIRPTAFNPYYPADQDGHHLPEPEINDDPLKDLEAPSYMNNAFLNKAEEILHNQQHEQRRMALRQPPIVNTQEDYPMPPRYEDVFSDTNVNATLPQNQIGKSSTPASATPASAASASAASGSAATQLLLTFGKYGEISTMPGAFREPSRINVSSGGGFVIVTDPKNENVQTFDLNGECLSLIKVSNVTSCTMLEPNRLIVGTNTGLQFFDLNGIKSGELPIGPVVNVTSKSPNFYVVVQKQSFTLFSVDNLKIKEVDSGWLPSDEKQEFVNLVDVALTIKEDFAVLDGGANGGTGAIYVLGANVNHIKSAIFPKRETCGSLVQPSSISVDRNNRILICDSGNKRVLSFKSGREPIISQVLSSESWPPGSGVYPASLDASNAKIYVIQRSERFVEIAVYSLP